MDPRTYATLYGPWRPKPSPRPGRTVVGVLAGALWCVTLLSCAVLAFDGAIAALWGTSTAGDLLLRYALITVGTVAVLAALAFAPGVRRLPTEGRLLLMGAVAFPVPAFLAIGVLSQLG